MTTSTTRMPLPAPTCDDREIKDSLDEFGLAIVPDLLDAQQLAAVRNRLIEQAAGERAAGVASSNGRNRSPDNPIQYVWSLVAKGEEFRDLITHPRALGYVRHVLGPEVTIFSFSGNAIGPGAPGGGAHTDQIYMPADTPWPVVCNVIYMLDDFTEENGATLVVPGSHRRPFSDLTPETFAAEAVSATGRAGSALVMESRVFHSIGVNRTKDVVRHGILAAYGAPFLRPQENWTFSTPTELVEQASPELRELLGFKIWRSLGGAQGPYGKRLEDTFDAGAVQHHRGANLDVQGIDWGWVAPAPEFVGELAADGSRKA